ncbi:bile salt sulfotransferase-like [Choloepus didactylus]|uniref:bile salt sulfotransferase-like n=1 Tax=Choloepus didactylus TaxID=27675 RepID=UPI00189CD5F4|nr:bile salt sulfotransferase-like [Choloepus didactylus]
MEHPDSAGQEVFQTDADNVWVEAIPLTTLADKNLLSLRDEFVVRDGDVITLSYPKSGTNWLLEIISLIHSKGDPSWVQSVSSWERSPWLEYLVGQKQIEDHPSEKCPRFYSSHLPIQLFPKSFFNSKAKAIYIIRNPRDIITSGYFFWGASKIFKTPESFEQFFQWFLQGNVPYGSWFDHIRGWLTMRGKENFLIVAYEDLHQDLRASTEVISQFLGKKLTPEEVDSVLKNTSFQAMKENSMRESFQIPKNVLDNSKGQLMRKVLNLLEEIILWTRIVLLKFGLCGRCHQ